MNNGERIYNISYLRISSGVAIPNYNPFEQQLSKNTTAYYEKIKSNYMKTKKTKKE